MSDQETPSEAAAAPTSSSSPVSGAPSKDICAVCLHPHVLPVTLPCGHIFCYLCVKGFASRSRSCALCRDEFPRDFCDRPCVLDPSHVIELSQRAISSDGCQWYYSGANGWWQYEERIAKELEEAFAAKQSSVTICVSGYHYVVDFVEMVQYKESDPMRRRRVKRDAADSQKKGVAGILLHAPSPSEQADKPEEAEAPVEERQRRRRRTRRRPAEVEAEEEEEEPDIVDEFASLSINPTSRSG